MSENDYGTSGGVRLTDEVINKLADEAEQGYDLDKVKQGYDMYSGVSKDCMLCGAITPPGHMMVHSSEHKIVGRICSSHTLVEVIMDPRDIFDIVVTADVPEVQASGE